MKLENEFTVKAPLDQTWDALLDVERVAGCLPGARVVPSGREGIYDGQMKVKLGAMTVAYKGSVSMTEVDEIAHRVVMDLDAKELKGQGGAKARMENRLTSDGDGQTRVHVGTVLDVSGRTAQLGRGMMQSVAGRLLDDFAQRLEHELAGPLQANGAEPSRAREPETAPTRQTAGGPETAHRPGSAGERASASAEAEPLDVGSVMFGALGTKGASVVLAAVFLSPLVIRLLRRRRRGLALVMRERRVLRTRSVELRLGS